MTKESSRFIPPQKAKEIIHAFREDIVSPLQWVAVLVNPSLAELEEILDFDVFQLHGEESPVFCKSLKEKFPKKEIWKVFRPQIPEDLLEIRNYKMCDAILLDAFCTEKRGGTGKTLEEEILKNAKSFCAPHQKLIIAGGVSSQNMHHILNLSHADGVDISSSLEQSVGKKDEQKMQALQNIL